MSNAVDTHNRTATIDTLIDKLEFFSLLLIIIVNPFQLPVNASTEISFWLVKGGAIAIFFTAQQRGWKKTDRIFE